MVEVKVGGIQLTARDVEIMKFINDFGFVEMPQIEKRFSIKFYLVYRLLRRFISAGLMNYRKVFHSRHGVYYLTTKGAQLTDLPAIDKIPIGSYEHQLILTNVCIKLQQQYPDAILLSERRLKYDKFFNGVGNRGHIADGMIVLSDGKQIAIEVELSVKGKNRIEKILKEYGAQFSIKEVWYYCPAPVMSILRVAAEKKPFIKVHDLDEFLS